VSPASPHAALWPLERGLAFLNHGSFGACPTEVLRHQSALRAEMEAEPVRFLSRELDDRLDAARTALAAFVTAAPEDLAFVTNATSGGRH
jgi:isopenicillin-N epimerase